MFSAARIDSAADFLQVGRSVCACGPEPKTGRAIIVRLAERGTVSSTLIALPNDLSQSVYEFAAGPPDVTPYHDYSLDARKLLAGELSRRQSRGAASESQ